MRGRASWQVEDGIHRDHDLDLRRCSAVVGALLFIAASRATAQQDHERPVMVSLEYNVIDDHVADPALAHGWGAEVAFSGRVAVHVSPTTYVGFGAGSVETESDVCVDGVCDATLHGSVSLADLNQLFIQQYVVARHGFVRAGAGVARTETLVSGGQFINGATHWRKIISVGIGWDIHLTRRLAATPSVDYTRLLSATTQREINTVYAFGVALTFF